jgi:hypothetical protein
MGRAPVNVARGYRGTREDATDGFEHIQDVLLRYSCADGVVAMTTPSLRHFVAALPP